METPDTTSRVGKREKPRAQAVTPSEDPGNSGQEKLRPEAREAQVKEEPKASVKKRTRRSEPKHGPKIGSNEIDREDAIRSGF